MKRPKTGGEIHPLALDVTGREDQLPQLEKLFRLWREIEQEIGALAAGDDADRAQQCAELISAQTVIMNTAARCAAASYRDLLFKLAMWRWDAAELDGSLEQMQRSDALAYSAFRDLVEMTGEPIAMTERDEVTNLLRNPLAA